MSDHMTYGQRWADVIIQGASDRETIAVIQAINAVTAERRANLAAVMVACAQILAQSITNADPDIAGEVRAGVLALVDGFAMQSAIQEPQP